MARIACVNLTKTYQLADQTIPAVDRVNLVIEPGELVSIVGHSGSGKTTLVSIIGGILRPTAGQVLFGDTDICAFDDDRLSRYRSTRIGFVFQFASLLPILTARENVLLPGLFRPAGGPALTPADADRALDLVGVGDRAAAFPGQLSGGQQRRVAIARALAYQPQVLLADEPTGDLDEATEQEIMALFRQINAERKMTVILITHNLELANTARRRLRMSRGVLEEL
ncbi:MAG: ABC transporter ATP-binding protein [Thermodesulfobacteriota bacterium]